ncbi:hypothetical protein [uncultured Rhodoblastus sp.]|uniref:hypothetical protein n=1 Tax=uncultured Rhodoblastus sp. TaxID=543037 RepID=UPI0025DAC4E4|nr:hypothetical protein [uncultured Rhodoblastus sp.]
MKKANAVPRKQPRDDHVLLNVIVILVMILLTAFLAETFPGGAFDSEAPTGLMQGWAPRSR